MMINCEGKASLQEAIARDALRACLMQLRAASQMLSGGVVCGEGRFPQQLWLDGFISGVVCPAANSYRSLLASGNRKYVSAHRTNEAGLTILTDIVENFYTIHET